MDKLEIKHLAPYIGRGLQVCGYSNNKRIIRPLNRSMLFAVDRLVYKPVMRSLADLNDIDIFMLFGEDREDVGRLWIDGVHAMFCRFDFALEKIDYLLDNHYDIFGLIENNLAIDVKTLYHGSNE